MKLHYVWVGGIVPEEVKKCLASWAVYLPQFEICEWNETNIPKNDYVSQALAIRNYAAVSNYVRAWALFEYGGLYLDTDVEILDFRLGEYIRDSLNCDVLLGIESRDPFVVNNAVIFCRNHSSKLMNLVLREFDSYDGKEPANVSGPLLLTNVLKRHSYINVVLLEPEVLYSYRWDRYYEEINKSAWLLHYGEATWIEALEIDFYIDGQIEYKKKYLVARKYIYDLEQGSLRFIFKSIKNLIIRKIYKK